MGLTFPGGDHDTQLEDRPRRPPVVKTLSDIKIYDPRERPRDKPRTIHFGADFNGFRVTTSTPTVTTAAATTAGHLHTTPSTGVPQEDIKGLPAPDILLHAFGLLQNGQAPTSTLAPQPYDHWETSNSIAVPNTPGPLHSSPLSPVKKLPSAHPHPPTTALPLPVEISSVPPPITFSSLPPPYVSSRRAVVDSHSTPMPVVHNANPVSYTTASSNVYINKGDHHLPDGQPPAYGSSTPFLSHHEITTTTYHVTSTQPPPVKHHPTEPPTYVGSSTPHPDHYPHFSTVEPTGVYVESHADPTPFTVYSTPVSQYLEVPKHEQAFNHRHADLQQQHRHEFSPLPPPDTRINNLPDVLATLFHHQVQHSTTPATHHYDFSQILDLMKHHGYNPSLTDSSSVKSLPELLEHLSVYKDPHPKDDEIPPYGLKVKSLPEYAPGPAHHHHQLGSGGTPVDHSPPGVKSLRPKVKPRPHHHHQPEEYYSQPTALPPPPPPPPYPNPGYPEPPPSSTTLVSQLHHAPYPHYPPQKSQDPSKLLDHFFLVFHQNKCSLLILVFKCLMSSCRKAKLLWCP